MNLDDILGYQLDMTRHAALRSVHRILAGFPLRPADTTALLLVRDRPGCDQAMLGRALSGNRSVGMKVASRLEAMGLLTRADGRNGRTRSLYLTEDGERLLSEAIERHERAEVQLGVHLEDGERETLLALLAKVRRAVGDEEAGAATKPVVAQRANSIR